jgi:hypothetical protein
VFNVTGSPVTTAGTLTATLASQNANLVFAGPSLGGAAAPTFRPIVAADLPATTVTAGAYSLANVTVDAQGRLTEASSTQVANRGSGQGTVMVASAGTIAFKTLRAGSNVSITENANEITVAASGGGVGGGVTVFNIRVNFANNTSTPVDTVNTVPASGVGTLPAGWSVTATTTQVTFTVPSGTFTPPNTPTVTLAGRTSAGAYSIRSASNAAGLFTVTATDTTLAIGSLTASNTGASAPSDNHIWVRIIV